jgi:hypothetical protein
MMFDVLCVGVAREYGYGRALADEIFSCAFSRRSLKSKKPKNGVDTRATSDARRRSQQRQIDAYRRFSAIFEALSMLRVTIGRVHVAPFIAAAH